MNSRASLAQQRTLLQNQLRAQREKIVAQLCEEKNQNAHFPRSATMRFFTGKMGMKLVTDIAVQQLYVRHPGTVAITQGLSRWLSRMLTAKLLPQV